MSSQTRKVKQDELRRLMSLQKRKLTETAKKIESPLARYDEDGTLNCIICQTIVRSEAVWTVHLNSKKHKDNVANRVKKKEQPVEPQPNNQLVKRPASPTPSPVSAKKMKGILKNAPPTSSITPSISREALEKESDKEKNVSLVAEELKSDGPHESSKSNEEETDESSKKEALPEGFFDDPKLDAKVRNVEYKDPIEEEWEQFQREIREETSKAQQIIAEDQEEATTERQIDEIDEQLRNWNRVVSLEKKKQEIVAAPVVPVKTIKVRDSSGEEDDFEEFLDWRSKRSYD